MTDSLLCIICESGVLDYEALARAGSCNTLLYPPCDQLLCPARAKKRARLFMTIRRATYVLLYVYELASLRRL